MKNVDYKNDLKFISGILIKEIAEIEMELTPFRNIYQTLKFDPKHNVSSEDIDKIGFLLVIRESYKNLVYSYPENCNAIPWIKVKNFNKDNFTKLCIGKPVKNINEFAAFISFMQYYSTKFIDASLIIRVKESEINPEHLNFYRANIRNLINLFIKTYEKEKERLNNLESYKNLIDEYKNNPTMERYNNLMSKISYLKEISSINICNFKMILNNHFENNKETPYQFNLEVNHSSRQERKDEHKKLYADAEPETLEGKPLEQLNEIYSFLCETLSNKEDYKIIVADLSSLFECVDPSSIDIIIANLIYMLNNNQDLNEERKTTLVKRLGQIKK